MKAIVIFLLVVQSLNLMISFKVLLTTKTWPLVRESKEPGLVFAEAVIEIALITWCALVLTCGS